MAANGGGTVPDRSDVSSRASPLLRIRKGTRPVREGLVYLLKVLVATALASSRWVTVMVAVSVPLMVT